MQEVKPLYNLFPWQMDVFRGVMGNRRDSVHIVKSRRQCGKTFVVEALFANFCYGYDPIAGALLRCQNILLEPTFKQGRKVFREFKKYIKQRVPQIIESSNESELLIEFVGGGSLRILSAEMDEEAIRGYTVTGLFVIDEAAYISDEVYSWCAPFTDVWHATTLMISTPNMKTGFFYDHYQLAINGEPGVYYYDFNDYDTTQLLSPEKLERYRKTIPAQIFRKDYLGEWLELEGDVFGNFKHILCNAYDGEDRNLTMAVDWGAGTKNDYTAVVIFNGKKQMVYLDYFNNLEPDETIKRILAAATKWGVRVIKVEINSIGEVYFKLLRKAATKQGLNNVMPFVTTNDSKNRIIDTIRVGIEQGQITLFNDPELCVELSMLKQEKTPGGKITYNATKGYHDDIIIAIGIALDGMEAGQYCFSTT